MGCTVAVVFNTKENETLTESLTNDLFQDAYIEMSKYIRSKGCDFFIAHRVEDYLGNGSFKNISYINEDGSLKYADRGKADVVYDKGWFKATDIPVLNSPSLQKILESKHETYDILSTYHAPSKLFSNEQELTDELRSYDGDTILVVKEDRGNGGHGVEIDKASALQNKILINFPYIVQQFIDTSGGIEGVTEYAHDLRVVMLDGYPIFTMVREIKGQGKKANIHYGGEIKPLELSDLSESVILICKQIDMEITFKNRLYSIDLGLDISGEWFVFELNPRTGIYSPKLFGNPALVYIHKVSDKLMEMAKA